MIIAAIVILAVAGALFMVRVIIGPSLADRIIALDGLVVTAVAAIILASIERGTSLYLGVALVVAFIGFVGTTAGARFIERRGG